jgi:hypothetical protein
MLPRKPSLAAAALLFAAPVSADVTIQEGPEKVRVEIDGKLFTEYCFTGAPHVYFHPLIGPGGAKMTRSWPMEEVPNEERDHPHHRSLWYAHGAVNGVDFWSEAASHKGTPKHPVGKIVHDRIVEAKGGEQEGVIVAQCKWVAPDGSVPLTSRQTFRVYDRPENERLFDFEVTLTAGEKEVVLGDTKEGTMAIRVAESMRLKQPKGRPAGGGRIVNNNGVRDGEAWGKQAAWVDYSGPVDGKVVGVAIFDHPKNPRHPTRWHVRDYGLFAVNPFCGHEMDKSIPKGAADYKLAAGESVTFRYRFLLHEGDAEQGKVAERFAEYAAAAK